MEERRTEDFGFLYLVSKFKAQGIAPLLFPSSCLPSPSFPPVSVPPVSILPFSSTSTIKTVLVQYQNDVVQPLVHS